MVKRVAGVVLFLFGILLSFSILSFVLKMIFIKNLDVAGEDEVYKTAYYSGQIVTVLLFCFLTFLSFKYGYRWMKGKTNSKIATEEIDSIGTNESSL